MNSKVFWITIMLLGSLWMAALVLGQAEAQAVAIPTGLVESQSSQISGRFYGDDPDGAESELQAGPLTPCPGWTLYYDLTITNTMTITPLTGLVISDSLPAGTWYAGDSGGDCPAHYDSQSRTITWPADPLPPGHVLRINWELRSYSWLGAGTAISNTIVYAATELEGQGRVTGVSTIAHCSPAHTPTPQPTPEPTCTPTRISYQVSLPCVIRR